MKGFKPFVTLSTNEDVLINFNERLGPWTYGTYFKGFSKSMNKDVMVKVVDLKKFPLTKEHLDTEISLLKKLQSNNYVVRFAEYKYYNNTLTLVTDICNKGNLRDYLKKNGPIPERKALHMLLQLIYGLRGLDELKYAHCALRPENILLHQEENGQLTAKISNLIFARPYDSVPFKKEQMPYDSQYLSPEVLKRIKCHAKSDIWALGVIYFEMLYGYLPWSGKDMKELENNILNIRLQFPLDVEGITETSINFIQKCLERDHERRYTWTDIMQHRLIFRGLFSKGDGTYKAMNDEFREQTPTSRSLMYGLRRENSMKTLSFSTYKPMQRLNTMKPKEKQALFSRQSTIRSRNESDFDDPKVIFLTEQDNRKGDDRGDTIEVIKILDGNKPLLRATSASNVLKNPRGMERKKSANNLAVSTLQPRPMPRGQGIKYYENLMANVFTSSEILNTQTSNAQNFGVVLKAGQDFSGPFKSLSLKAEMLGEIYELATSNKEYPLYDKIIKILEQEAQKFGDGVSSVGNIQQKLTKKIEASRSSSNLRQSPKRGEVIFPPAPKPKQALAKKEKSKDIYNLLREMTVQLVTFNKVTVSNEDMLTIAANFKILREFDEIGENVLRELATLKDILLTFYRKKHYDHLKYLLLVKNLV